MEFQTDVLLTIVRESVSLFVLLVFGSYAYRLLVSLVDVFDRNLARISKSLEEIARK